MENNRTIRRNRRPRDTHHLGASLQGTPPLRNSFKPIEPMSQDQLMAIHEASLWLLEEVGIEMCNLKLGIRPRVPYVFFNARFWTDLKKQIHHMIATRRAPAWMADYVLFTDDPDEVVAFYRRKLQVL